MSRKIDEYMSNPDEFSVDEDNIQELMSEMDQPAAVASEAPGEELEVEAEVIAAGDDKPEAEKEKPEAKAEPEEVELQPVVKTRDGKHEIPYSVLERERRDRLGAQRQLEELQRQMAQQAQKPEAKAQEDQSNGTSADTDEIDLEAFRDEFGDELAEVERKRREKYAAMEKRQAALEKEIEESRKWRQSKEAEAKQSAESEINEAIDSLPELREWRDTQDPLWDAAVALDTRLRNDPAYADYSYRDRFSAVLERLTGRNPASKPKPQEDAQEALEKKLRESDANSSIPSSLSDLPGGHTADQSEHETLDRMTVGQLEAKFASMSPEQQSAYLARL